MWRNRPRQTGAEKGQAEVSEGGKIGGSQVCEGQQDWPPLELAYRFSFLLVSDRLGSPCLFLCRSHTVLPGEKLSGALCLTWILPSSLSMS